MAVATTATPEDAAEHKENDHKKTNYNNIYQSSNCKRVKHKSNYKTPLRKSLISCDNNCDSNINSFTCTIVYIVVECRTLCSGLNWKSISVR